MGTLNVVDIKTTRESKEGLRPFDKIGCVHTKTETTYPLLANTVIQPPNHPTQPINQLTEQPAQPPYQPNIHAALNVVVVVVIVSLTSLNLSAQSLIGRLKALEVVWQLPLVRQIRSAPLHHHSHLKDG